MHKSQTALPWRAKYCRLVMVKGENWVQLTSRWLPLLLKPRLALRNLELSCKPGKYLCSRNTSLPVGSSYLLIFPGSPDRNQLLENTEILFFWDDWSLQCISTPLPPSLSHKVLLPAGTDAPHAPFSQSCLWSWWELRGDWCEWGAGGGMSGAIWNLCCLMGWDYSFLFLRFKKKNVHSLLFWDVCILLVAVRQKELLWFWRTPPEPVYLCRADCDR